MRVEWTEYALGELLVAVDELIAHRGARAQKRILDHVLERVRALADLPWAGPEWKPGGDVSFRRLVVEDHVLLYRVMEKENVVFILAFRHGRRRPVEPGEVPGT
jgi:plasmid stabilization system protein ParE